MRGRRPSVACIANAIEPWTLNPDKNKPHRHAHAQALELPGALNRCYLGLGWASQPGAREIDLDASAALFSHGPAPKP